MPIHDTDSANGKLVNNKVIIVGRTNSTATAETANVQVKHNKGHGYKTRIGIDTDYTTADDSTSDKRRDSNLNLGSGDLVRSGGTGGNIKANKKLKRYFYSALQSTTDTTSNIYDLHGRLLQADGGNIKLVADSSLPTTDNSGRIVNKTDASATDGKDNDSSPGLNTYNDTVTYYTKINASATVKTQSLTLSTSK